MIDYRADQVDWKLISCLVRSIPEIVAFELGGSAGNLSHFESKDVRIKVSEMHKFDANRKNLEICIFTDDYPLRRTDLSLRTENIKNRIETLLGMSGYRIAGRCAVVLGHGACSEFETK